MAHRHHLVTLRNYSHNLDGQINVRFTCNTPSGGELMDMDIRRNHVQLHVHVDYTVQMRPDVRNNRVIALKARNSMLLTLLLQPDLNQIQC